MLLGTGRCKFSSGQAAPIQQLVQGGDTDLGRQKLPACVLALLLTLRQRMLLHVVGLLQAFHELLVVEQNLRATVAACTQCPAIPGFDRITLQLAQLFTGGLA